MNNIVIDVFFVDKNGRNIFISKKNPKIQKIMNASKPPFENNLKVYKYNNLHLCVDKNYNKICKNVEYISSNFNKNLLMIESKITNIDIFMFPFIDNYNEIISQHIIDYDDVSIITETNILSNEMVTFIRIKNKQSLNKILKLIE